MALDRTAAALRQTRRLIGRGRDLSGRLSGLGQRVKQLRPGTHQPLSDATTASHDGSMSAERRSLVRSPIDD
jgi:hypothetical protein